MAHHRSTTRASVPLLTFDVDATPCGDEAVFGFARVVLTARALSLIRGALDGEALEADAVLVRGLYDLARGGAAPPERVDTLDRGADLLVGGELDAVVGVSVEPDREVQAQPAAPCSRSCP